MAEKRTGAGELAIAALDAAPACPGYDSGATNAIDVCRRTLSATISSSWGKSSIVIRELSLGGGMERKEDNLRRGSERTSRLPPAYVACAGKCYCAAPA